VELADEQHLFVPFAAVTGGRPLPVDQLRGKRIPLGFEVRSGLFEGTKAADQQLASRLWQF
jgi:hypothetical protein